MNTLLDNLDYIIEHCGVQHDFRLVPSVIVGTNDFRFRATLSNLKGYPSEISGLGKSYTQAVEQVVERLKTYITEEITVIIKIPVIEILNKGVTDDMLVDYVEEALGSHGGGYDPKEHPLFGGINCTATAHIPEIYLPTDKEVSS